MSIQLQSPIVYPSWTGPSLLWKPTVLGSALNLWLASDSGATVVSSRISALVDKSANAATLSQASGTAQLLYTASAQNGLPGVSNDASTTTPKNLKSVAYLPPVAYEYNQAFSVSFAFIYNAGTRSSFSFNFGQYDPSNQLRGIIIGAGSSSAGFVANTLNIRMLNSNGSSIGIRVCGSTTLITGHCYICTITYDGSGVAAGIKMYVNGTTAEGKTVVTDTLASATLVSTAATSLFYIGGDTTSDSNPDTFLECFYSNAVYSSGNLTGAFQYLNSRYAAY